MERKRKYLRYAFNLIEIVLAMGVVGIGIAGVMSLMVPALSANRDAQGETVAVEAASKLKAWLQLTSAGSNAGNWLSNMTGFGIPATVTNGVITPVSVSSISFPGDSKVEATENIVLDKTNAETKKDSDLFLRNPDNDHRNYVHVDSNGEALAYIFLYRLNDSSNTNLIRYVIEVTWPAVSTIPYNSPNRRFRRFSFEIMNPYYP